jgi:RHS repeat-associated protein
MHGHWGSGRRRSGLDRLDGRFAHTHRALKPTLTRSRLVSRGVWLFMFLAALALFLSAGAGIAQAAEGDPPTVTGLSVTAGPTTGGTSVTVTGTGFTGATAVTFGGMGSAGFVVDSDTQITATSPARATGIVPVQVTTPAGASADTAADDFTYAAPARYQQIDSKLTYLGAWSVGSTWSASGGSFHYTSSPGAAVVANFNGTAVALAATTGRGYGKGLVSLDGGSEEEVDFYSATTLYKRSVYAKSGLTAGDHTLVIKCLWEKNLLATGYSISLDAVDILGTLTQAPLPTRYQQNDLNLKYMGTWTTSSNWSASGSSFTYVNSPGAAANVTFDGTYLTWYATMGTGYGKAQVSLDGGTPVLVDFYASYTKYKQRVYSTGLLADGPHTLSIYWVGQKNAAATGTTIGVDAFDILGTATLAPEPEPILWRYQQNDTRLSYLGAWSSVSTWSASGGSLISTGVAGAAVVVNFNGTSVNLLAKTAPWYGLALVSLDGAPEEEVDFYSATTLYKRSVYEKTGLASRAHILTIKCKGDHNSPSTGNSISLDALDITGTMTKAPAIMRYQQENTALDYAGTWTTTSTWPASGGSLISTNASGGQLTVNFTGQYLAWYAKTAPWNGIATVTLDGVPAAPPVDLYSAAQVYKKLVYTTGLLNNGAHTLVVQWSGTKRPAASGTSINVDAFDILGTLDRALSISGLSVTSGPTPGENQVVISGAGFVGVTGVNFGDAAVPVSDYTVDSAGKITVTRVPAHAAGLVRVSVSNASRTSADTPADDYTYADAPTVTGLDRIIGPASGGTAVVITGTGFLGVSGVTFGGTAATIFTVDSQTQITATTPAHAAGTGVVQVTAVGGVSGDTAADDFAYVDAPTIAGLSPSAGPSAGATEVIITGTDFMGVGAVSFGGQAATIFTVDSPTQITATAPAHAAGAVQVQVSAVGGVSGDTAADDFTYTDEAYVVHVSGTLTEDTTWSGAHLYVVDSTVTIPVGVTLTIQPGTVVKGWGGSWWNTNLDVRGTLIAQGTAEAPIYFTSYSDDSIGGDTNADGSGSVPSESDWNGITGTGAISLAHVVVRYATCAIYGSGSEERPLNLSLTDSVLEHNYYGLSASGTVTATISGNTFRDNSSGQYLGWLYGLSQVAITGNTFRDSAYGLSVSGSAQAVVTGNTFLNNSGDGCVLNIVPQPGSQFADNTVTGNAGWGMGLSFAALPLFSGGHNTVAGNGHQNGVMLYAGSEMAGNATLTPDISWVIVGTTYGDGTVAAGATLTVQPGTVVKGWGGRGFNTNLYVRGTLIAQGTEADPIYFTSCSDDSIGGDTNADGAASVPSESDWNGITGTGAISLAHVVVRYATCAIYGSGSQERPLNLSLTDSVLEHNSNSLSASGTVTATITGNTFRDNSGYAVYWGGSGQLYAPNNWWGQVSGPRPDQINTQYYRDPQGVLRERPAVNASPWVGYSTYIASLGGAGGDSSSARSSQKRCSSAVGEPVNAATGNFYLQVTDHSVSGYGPALALIRTYNALAPVEGSMGWGWRHSFEATVEVDEVAAQVNVTYPDGHGALFAIEADGSYTAAAGNFAGLTKDGSGYSLTEKDQSVCRFDLDGRLMTIADRRGNTLTLSYTAQGRILSVTDAAGSMLSFAYNAEGRLASVTDPLGRQSTYAYDVNGNLTAAADRSGATTTYGYYADHRMLSATDALGRAFVTNEYDLQGRVVKQWDAAGALSTLAYLDKNTSTGYLETVFTDAKGNATTYSYDDDYREVAQTDALGNTARFAYDTSNNRTAITDKRGNTTVFTYDTQGNEVTRTDALDSVTTRTYSVANELLSETDPRGDTTDFAYDDDGNLTELTDARGATWTSAYDGHGLLVALTDPLDRTTGYGYDARGNVTRTTFADGTHTDSTFDLAGRNLSRADELGRATTYTYDGEDRLLTVVDALDGVATTVYDAAGQATSRTDRTDRTTAYAYDLNGRLLSETYPGAGATTYERDANGNVTKVTDATARSTLSRYDALDRKIEVEDGLTSVTVTTYDPNGNVTKLTDAAGSATLMTYDALNRLVLVTDALGGTQSYEYDAAGNRTVVTDPLGAISNTEYDELNRAISVTDRSGLAATSTYDAAGRLTQSVDRMGQKTTYTYDDRDRVTGFADPDGTTTYVYDAAGHRTQAADAAGSIAISYDDLGRASVRTDPNGKAVAYSYDAEGRRTWIAYPDAKTTTSAYDPAGRLASVTDWSSAVTVYGYDGAGRLITTLYPNGATETRSYDAVGNLSEIKTTKDSTILEDLDYVYDARGNRLSETSLDGTTAFTYDDLSRLASVTYADASVESYTYDAAGNRLTKASAPDVISYIYSTAGRLESLEDGGHTSFTYDSNGNTLTAVTPAGTTTFTYDAQDRAVAIDDGTRTETMSYDADGVLIKKMLDGVTTTFVQDALASNEQVLQETSGSSATSFVLGVTRLASENAGGRTYLHADALGSTRLLTDETGTESGTTTYGAWGGVRASSGTGSSFAFTGEETDPFGLTYLRARYYDPNLGRFLQEDLQPGLVTDTQGLAAYVYCRDNPVMMTDPSGQMAKWLQDMLIAQGSNGAEVGFDWRTWASSGLKAGNKVATLIEQSATMARGTPINVVSLKYANVAANLKSAGNILSLLNFGVSFFDQVTSHDEGNAALTASRAAIVAGSGGVGGALGASAGMAIGGTLGSFIPIPFVGTAAGMVVGGAIGGWVGSEAGKAVGETIYGGATAVGNAIADCWPRW